MGAPGATGAPAGAMPGVSAVRVRGYPSTSHAPGQPRLAIPEGCSAPAFPAAAAAAAAAPTGPLVPSTVLKLESLLEQGVIYPGFLSSDATALEADHSQPSQR